MRIIDELTKFTTLDTLAEIRKRLLEEIITKRANERAFDWQRQIEFHRQGETTTFSPLHILFSATDPNSIEIIRAVLEDMIKKGEKQELQHLLLHTKDSNGKACFDYDIDLRLIPAAEASVQTEVSRKSMFK